MSVYVVIHTYHIKTSLPPLSEASYRHVRMTEWTYFLQSARCMGFFSLICLVTQGLGVAFSADRRLVSQFARHTETQRHRASDLFFQ